MANRFDQRLMTMMPANRRKWWVFYGVDKDDVFGIDTMWKNNDKNLKMLVQMCEMNAEWNPAYANFNKIIQQVANVVEEETKQLQRALDCFIPEIASIIIKLC